MDDVTYVISKLLWIPARPGTAALLLACLGLALLWRGRRWGRWPALAGLGFFVLLNLLPLHQWVQQPLEDRFPRPATEPATIAGIVVLGGAVEQNLTEARGIPALNGAAERMTEPVALLRRHPEAKLVFTGGQGSLVHGGVTEADVAAALWRDLGVPADRLLLEREARNTWENAVLSHRLVQPKPGETWLLVTSASHMPRAAGVFRQAGWDITPWPVNYRTGNTAAVRLDASFPERLREFEWGTREWVGLLSYRLMGRMGAVFPGP
ncbi:YdcF family protein [Paeniroseomonas aquatica]|uniref:YdcF family protein n=1 Tax=Paeniroseomonas aquatica TaxID=373043 RepID=A0ABT8AES7_9PROT|nr:YdcF family protein [Paeniroseomonas aquatica]MDN3568342.1 YdcF family protein [Paeniroseomonas aquatica]